ncbi:hypothetical protein EDD15DRAFT_1164371 [Pisolithus albus]|nr:hypothetical protein EDD15DRAFT_1164371 [Pisolithus albus]
MSILIRSPPQGISTSCSGYFTQLDSSSCYSSTSSMNSASLSDANAALNVCASSVTPQWADSTQRSSLYASCSAKSTPFSNQDVKRICNTVYVLPPLGTAIRSTSDSRQYCAAQLDSQSGSVDAITQGFNPSSREQYLYQPCLFLSLEPSTDSTTICTSCSKTILVPFISFEFDAPYAPVLNNSVQTTCGAGFLSGVVQAAGGLSSCILSGDARVLSATMSYSQFSEPPHSL